MYNYKVIGGNQHAYGPVSAADVRQWIGDGRLNAQSLAQAETSSEWKPLGDFPEFADVLRQPKAPPQLSPVPANLTDWTSQILAREPELRLGECLSSGVVFFRANAGFVIAAVSITWLLNVMIAFIPVIPMLLTGVLTGGLYLACLRRMRGEAASVGSIFDGFKLCFVQLMLTGAISGLLAELSILLCLLPWIYLTVAWVFALPLVADKRLEFWSAMELSRKVVTRVWFAMFLLLVVVFLPYLVGKAFVGFKTGAFLLGTLREVDFDVTRWITSLSQRIPELSWTILISTLGMQLLKLLCQFIAVGALMQAYENLFGTRQS